MTNIKEEFTEEEIVITRELLLEALAEDLLDHLAELMEVISEKNDQYPQLLDEEWPACTALIKRATEFLYPCEKDLNKNAAKNHTK